MSKKFQLLTGYVQIAGDARATTFRGDDDPMTLAETVVLQTVHGGQEHVHTLVQAGEAQRTMEDEYERLTRRYGNIVTSVFPPINGKVSLPLGDEDIPTQEEVAAAKEAANEAMAKTRAKRADKDKAAAPAKAKTEKSDDAPVAPLDTMKR